MGTKIFLEITELLNLADLLKEKNPDRNKKNFLKQIWTDGHHNTKNAANYYFLSSELLFFSKLLFFSELLFANRQTIAQLTSEIR